MADAVNSNSNIVSTQTVCNFGCTAFLIRSTNFHLKDGLLYGNNESSNFNNGIFMPVNSTHVTVGGSKVAEIHETIFSCFKSTSVFQVYKCPFSNDTLK